MERVPVLASQVDDVRCASPFNEVAKDFNRGLKEAVAQLRKDLPSTAITYVDVYAIKYALISQPKKFGELPIRRSIFSPRLGQDAMEE